MRRTAVALIGVALLVSACGPGDIDALFDDFAQTDLSQSSDLGERAANDSVIDVLTAREAEANLERGLADGDWTAMRQAANLRPDDPRYPMHEVIQLEADGLTGTDTWRTALQDAVADIARLHPDKDNANHRRLAAELQIEALRDAIAKTSDDTRREAMTREYCAALTESYPHHTESDPAAVAVFLATADYSLCP